MHIPIDDTYGPNEPSPSEFVTGARRTHVAVVFEDNDVAYIRDQVRDCLDYLASQLPSPPAEFHFAEIYNKRGIWKHLDGEKNLFLIDAFSEIYRRYRWKVFIQTVDERTLKDQPSLAELPEIDDLDPRNNWSDLSLLLLCLQIRIAYKESRPPISLLVDQGARAPNSPFGTKLFSNWGSSFTGKYESSSAEPLLQIADFLAFCINRVTYLGLKSVRTNVDYNFLEMVSEMKINCDQLKRWEVERGFSVKDVDAAHRDDRVKKGLE